MRIVCTPVFENVTRVACDSQYAVSCHPHPSNVFADASRDPATFIKAYRTSSSACSDPSHGVEFDALARDGPDLVNITGIVCDDGPQGSGRDFLSFFIIKPQAAGIGRSGTVTSGDIVKN